MNVERPDIRQIFNEAAEIPNAEDRAAYLARACGNDRQLRAEIEELLAHDAELGSLQDAPAAGIAATLDGSLISEQPGTYIGHYKLVEEIGEGGMGTVFLALQQQPVRRKVALKVIKPGMDSKQVVSRFEAERQALAMMDHPNIARVFDGGTTQLGRPYFVMELVHGIPVTDYCDRYRLTTNDRLGLFGAMCRAIQHAHQKGIIHRDLKPSNILVTLLDGKAIPKVIDFGIAKATSGHLTDGSLVTNFAQLVGTPLYMSPEQAEPSAVDVDTRSDVYSLGVILYELLTGTTPFDRDRVSSLSVDEFRRIIREEEPPRPSTRLSTLDAALDTVADKRHTDLRTLHHEVAGELDWIVMKALEKDRTRRYQSASDFANDAQRYLDDEPVEACPPSAAYRLRKYVHRNRAKVVAITTIASLLIIATVVSTCLAGWAIHAEGTSRTERTRALTAKGLAEKAEKLARRQEKLAREQQQLAVKQRDASERNRYLANMRVAQHDWKEGRTSRLYSVLEQCTPGANGPDFRQWEWFYFLSQCHKDLVTFDGLHGLTCSLTWSPDGRHLASANNGVMVWDFARRCRIRQLGPGTVYGIAWSPDGQYLCYGGSGANVVVCRTADWSELCRLRGHTGTIRGLAWSPDSRRLASVSLDRTVRIWDMIEKTQIRCLEGDSACFKTVAWSPHGRQLVAGSENGMIKLWNADTGDCVAMENLHRDSIWQLAWRPDSQQIASASSDGTIKIWDVAARQLDRTLKGHTSSVTSVSWRADGNQLASGSLDETVRIWDVAASRQIRRLRGHRDAVCSVAWQPGSGLLASGSAQGLVKIWDPVQQQDTLTLTVEGESAESIAFAANPRRMASVSREGTVRIWNTQSGEQETTVCQRLGAASQVVWSPDNRELLIGCDDRAEIWNLEDRTRRLTLPGRDGPIASVAWNYDGRNVAMVCHAKSARRMKDVIAVWNAKTGEEQQQVRGKWDETWTPGVVAWNPRSDRLAFAFDQCNLAVRVWDASEGRLLLASSFRPSSLASLLDATVAAAAWSPDGRTLAASVDQTIRLIDGETGTSIQTLTGHTGQVYSLAWHPEGHRLASVAADGSLRLWDAETGEEVFLEQRNGNGFHAVAWSSDGRQLATVNEDGTIDIRDATSAYDFVPSSGDRLRAAWRSIEVGQFEEAIQAVQLLADQYPDRSEFRDSLNACWQELAWSLSTDLDAQRTPSTQQRGLANRLVKALPTESSAWLGLAATQYCLGDIPAAETILHKVSKLGDVGGRWRLPYQALAAMVHWRLGDKTEAYLSYTRFLAAMEVESPSAESRRLRAMLAAALQRSILDPPLDDAIDLMTSLLTEFPETDGFRTELLTLYLKRAGDNHVAGQSTEEIRDITAAIQLTRDDNKKDLTSRFWLWDRRSRAYEAMGDTASAISEITEMIQLRHQEGYAYYRRGALYQRDGQFDQAIRDFDKTIETTPEHWLAYLHRAMAYTEKQDYQHANADLKAVLQLGAQEASALNDAAWRLATCPAIEFRDAARAVEAAQRALELSPDEASMWNTLGVSQYRAADYQNAQRSLARAMELASGGTPCDWLFTAMCHWQLGEKEQSRVWLERAAEWIETHNVEDELRRFHKEAVDLIDTPGSGSEKKQERHEETNGK